MDYGATSFANNRCRHIFANQRRFTEFIQLSIISLQCGKYQKIQQLVYTSQNLFDFGFEIVLTMKISTQFLTNVTKHLWLKCDKICQNTSLGKIFDQQLLQEMPEFCTSWVVGRCLNNFLDVTNFCPLSSSAFPLPSQNSNICSHVN